jgi:hypothetical protein
VATERVYRLGGSALYSWIVSGLLPVAIGLMLLFDSPIVIHSVLGVALVLFGLLVVAKSLNVRTVISDTHVVVHNHVKTASIALIEVVEINSTVVSTPLTRAMPWGRLRLSSGGRRSQLDVVATTGMKRDDVVQLVRLFTDRNSEIRVDVDISRFPA